MILMTVMTVMALLIVMTVKIAVIVTDAMTVMIVKYTQIVMTDCNDWNAFIFTHACAYTPTSA